VLIEVQGKTLVFLNVYFVVGLDKNIHSISEIMNHNPHLDVFFSNNR
jgi:hypothetical protein